MAKTVTGGYMERWHSAVEAMGVPSGFYNDILVRVVDDPTGKSDYSIGVVFNRGMSKRSVSTGPSVRCHMCRMSEEAELERVKNLFPENPISDYIITPNGFPRSAGAALFIARKERPMYNTNDLITDVELDELLRFGSSEGLRIYHQTVGAGATQGVHEHFHGTTLHTLQEKAGRSFGLDSAEVSKIPGANGVYVMPGAEFAHLIFDESDTERIVRFLSRMSFMLPSPLEDGSIPHTLSQSGDRKVLITPTRVDVEGSMGSERAPGYFFTYTKDEFDSVTYDSAKKFMSDRFFSKNVGLEKIL